MSIDTSINMKFSKKYRIKSDWEIQKVFKEGKRFFSKFYVIVYLNNNYDYPRIGVTVSKKVGKANKRNYEKRIIRNFFRDKSHLFPNYDIIIIKNKKEGTYREKKKDFINIVNNLGGNNEIFDNYDN